MYDTKNNWEQEQANNLPLEDKLLKKYVSIIESTDSKFNFFYYTPRFFKRNVFNEIIEDCATSKDMAFFIENEFDFKDMKEKLSLASKENTKSYHINSLEALFDETGKFKENYFLKTNKIFIALNYQKKDEVNPFILFDANDIPYSVYKYAPKKNSF